MASYAEEHGSFREENGRNNAARSGRQTLRTDPNLQAFFSASVIPDDAARQTLASALQNHQTGLNAAVIEQMVEQLVSEIGGQDSAADKGVDQLFLDSLDRVPLTRLKADDNCAICAEPYLDDKFPLVVELRCHHRFDLDCISPWLKLHSTCPMCRASVHPAPHAAIPEDSEEEDDMLYG